MTNKAFQFWLASAQTATDLVNLSTNYKIQVYVRQETAFIYWKTAAVIAVWHTHTRARSRQNIYRLNARMVKSPIHEYNYHEYVHMSVILAFKTNCWSSCGRLVSMRCMIFWCALSSRSYLPAFDGFRSYSLLRSPALCSKILRIRL